MPKRKGPESERDLKAQIGLEGEAFRNWLRAEFERAMGDPPGTLHPARVAVRKKLDEQRATREMNAHWKTQAT